MKRPLLINLFLIALISSVTVTLVAGCADGLFNSSAKRQETLLKLQESQAAAQRSLDAEKARAAQAEQELATQKAARLAAEQALTQAQAQGHNEEVTRLQAQIATFQTQITASQAVLDKANKSVALATKLKDLIDKGTTTFRASIQPDGSWDVTGAVVTGLSAIGGPAGLIAAAGTPLLGMIVKWIEASKAQKKADQTIADAASILQGIDRASIADPSLNTVLNKAWTEHVEPAMTEGAKKLVNEVSVT